MEGKAGRPAIADPRSEVFHETSRGFGSFGDRYWTHLRKEMGCASGDKIVMDICKGEKTFGHIIYINEYITNISLYIYRVGRVRMR